MIWSVPLDHRDQLNGVSAFNYLVLQEWAKSFEAMGAIRNNVCNVGADEHGQTPERVDCENFTPSVFKTLRTPILQGREFNDRDTAAGSLVVVINQTMAKGYWCRWSHVWFQLDAPYR